MGKDRKKSLNEHDTNLRGGGLKMDLLLVMVYPLALGLPVVPSSL